MPHLLVVRERFATTGAPGEQTGLVAALLLVLLVLELLVLVLALQQPLEETLILRLVPQQPPALRPFGGGVHDAAPVLRCVADGGGLTTSTRIRREEQDATSATTSASGRRRVGEQQEGVS